MQNFEEADSSDGAMSAPKRRLLNTGLGVFNPGLMAGNYHVATSLCLQLIGKGKNGGPAC